MHTSGLSVVATQWPVDIFSNLKLHLWSPVKKRARLLTREYSCDSRNNFGSFFICLQRITIIVCFDRFSVECAKLLECSKKVRFEQSGNDHMSYTRVLICTWRKTEKLILNIVQPPQSMRSRCWCLNVRTISVRICNIQHCRPDKEGCWGFDGSTKAERSLLMIRR